MELIQIAACVHHYFFPFKMGHLDVLISTRQTDRSQAERAMRSILQDLADCTGHPIDLPSPQETLLPLDPAPTIDLLLSPYLVHRTREAGAAEASRTAQILYDFANEIGGMPMAGVTPDLIEVWRGHRLLRIAESRVDEEHAIIRDFLNWCGHLEPEDEEPPFGPFGP